MTQLDAGRGKKLVIIDGNAIIHRAYHALPPLTTKEGLMVNAVYGFTSMLLKIYHDLKPDYLAVCFDVAGETFRDKLFAGYKAKRVKADQALYDQIPLVYEVVQAFGIPIYTKEGYEADDVIGTLVAKVKNQKSKIISHKSKASGRTAANVQPKNETVQSIIVTGDMDMLQLVADGAVEVYLLRKGLSDFELYNEARVVERFGFGSGLIVDYKALRGDASDNIPGVPGIGEKTAVELLRLAGGVEKLYKEIQNHKSKIINQIKPAITQKLIAGEESARLSLEIAAINCAVPDLGFDLEKCAAGEFDRERVMKLFQRFEFMSLAKRLPGTASLTKESEGSDFNAKGQGQHKGGKPRPSVLFQLDDAACREFFRLVKKSGSWAGREVLSGTAVLNSELLGVVCLVGERRYYFDLKRLSESACQEFFQLFTDKKIRLLGHDLKQLVKALAQRNLRVENELFDIMVASYLLNSGSRAHDLPSIALRELGQDIASADQGSLFGADPATIAHKLSVAAAVAPKYGAELKKTGMEKLFTDIEMPLILVLADMELAGVAVDTSELSKLSKDVNASIASLTKKICKEAGEEFNVSSSAQLREVLYEKMGLKIPGIKKGKTGYSTAASELEKLRGAHPIIELVEEYREVAKLQNTYIDVLPTLINKKTGRLHTSFNQTVAATGRLSSSDPNLQNIPVRTELGREIRDAFVAAPGHVLVSADYSQIELRIVASLAGDKRLMEIFRRGEDVHRATAAAIHHVSLEKVTKEMRSAAKEVNFGVLYGMGAYGLSWRAQIPQWQAKEFIEKYFREFSGVKAYIDKIIRLAREQGYVQTLFGRRRYIPELQSDNFQLRSAGERMAVNMPVQGTAADIMKLAMAAVHSRIRHHKSKIINQNVKMILQVHDELVLEAPKGSEDEVAALLKQEMEVAAGKLTVPVAVETSVGARWGELK